MKTTEIFPGKKWFAAQLLFVVLPGTSVFSQSFTLLSDERHLTVHLSGLSNCDQAPVSSFADFHGTSSNTNSDGDFYNAIQDSTFNSSQLICDAHIYLQGTVPAGGPSAIIGSYYSITFSVPSPVTAVFDYDGLSISDTGISYDGPSPHISLLGGPNPDVNLYGSQPSGSMEVGLMPGYNYTLVSQMTGFGNYFYDDPKPVEVAWQANMSLTIVPEPSPVLLLGAGLGALFGIRRLCR